MQYKQTQCKEHGGMFRVPVKRGRPPGQCNPQNPCTMARTKKTTAKTTSGGTVRPSRAEAVAKRPTETRKGGVVGAQERATRPRKVTPRTEPAKKATKSTPEASDVVVTHNPSIVLAKHARDLLEPQGWELHGRAWTDEEDAWAEVTGNRGSESIAIRFVNGKFYSQDYSLWDAEKTPGQNGMPKANLPFDPYEMSDGELAKELAGRKVTWWNRIGKNQETAIIGNKFQIHHYYEGTDESSRQVTFVDQTNGQYKFRSFNVDALMRVK